MNKQVDLLKGHTKDIAQQLAPLNAIARRDKGLRVREQAHFDLNRLRGTQSENATGLSGFVLAPRVAMVPVTCPNSDEGATGPSQLGTGDDGTMGICL